MLDDQPPCLTVQLLPDEVEIWVELPGYEGLYQISNRARIRSVGRNMTKGRIRKAFISRRGYMRLNLRRDGRYAPHTVHRLVASAFLGPCPNGMDVNHKDGNKLNNSPENLEYMSKLDNMRHAIRLGLIPAQPGETNPSAKLTEGQVAEIRNLLQGKSLSQKEIADMFGVSRSTIGEINRGKTWKRKDS